MSAHLLEPPLPYSLARSAGGLRSGTRRFAGGTLELVFRTADGPAHARIRQLPDARLAIELSAPDEASALARLRFLLALDVELGPFYASVAGDPLLGPAVMRARGRRVLPLDSPAHALLRGVCGQLVHSLDAMRIENAVLRAVAEPHAGLLLSPTQAELRTLGQARLESFGLAGRRAAALVRALKLLDLDALARLETPEVVARLVAHPGIGPWTAGAVVSEGLGRLDHGMVGDLGHVKLLTRLHGREPDAADLAELLDRYVPYQALASLYLQLVPQARLAASPRALAAFGARTG